MQDPHWLGLQGRAYAVTGAARGIGLGIAQALADAGARVALLDYDAVTCEETAAALRAQGLRAERDYLHRSVKSRMKAADRNKARYVAILGEDELARGEITVKKMATGEQKAVALEQLAHNIFEEENHS